MKKTALTLLVGVAATTMGGTMATANAATAPHPSVGIPPIAWATGGESTTQTDVPGYNNDKVTYTAPNAATVIETPWVNGKKTVTFTATSGAKFYPNNNPYSADGLGYNTGYNKRVITFTDSGNGAITTQTVCDDTVYYNYSNSPLTFQVVKYLPYHKAGTYLNGVKLTVNKPLTSAELAKIASLDDDDKLAYREDMALWGASEVKDSVTFTNAEITAAKGLNNAILKKTGWMPTANVAAVKAGETVVKAWALGVGADAVHKWGVTNTVAQTVYDALPYTALTGGCTIKHTVVTAPTVKAVTNYAN